MGKRIIAVEDVLEAFRSGNKRLAASPRECIVTPGARDKAAELGVLLADDPDAPSAGPSSKTPESKPSHTEQVVREVCSLMKQRLPKEVPAEHLERLVRDVVATRVAGGSGRPVSGEAAGAPCPDGVCFVSGARLLDTGANPIPVSEKVLVAEAIRCGENVKICGGYMEWEKASFSREVEFPEIGIVISGELTLTVGEKKLTATPGDMVYFPKGARVDYSTSGKVRIACVNCIP
jgi:ethanolamine utilization protein EutQ